MIARIGPRQPFRHFLREWRLHRGLTQQQVADRLETNKGNVANWENGKRGLSVDVQFALAEALAMQPEDLFRNPLQPSADALLRDASPEIRAQALAIIETLLRTAAR
jgi:transcriptional regulator with XRE-family HTH domain